MRTKQREWILLFACLFLGIIAELSFLHGTIGVTYIIFIVTFYVVLFARFRFAFEHRRIGLLLMIGIWVLAMSFLVFDSTVLYYLNIIMIPVVVFFHVVLITSPGRLNWGKLSFIRLVTGKLMDALQYLVHYLRYIGRRLLRSQRRMNNKILPQILVGLLGAALVLIIIFPLLTAANNTFQHFIQRMFFFQMGMNIVEISLRIIFILIAALFFFCVFQVLGRRTKREIRIQHVSERNKWNGVIVATFLIVLNSVYLLFTIILTKQFFLNDLPSGGHGELFAVSVINLVIILTFLKRVKAETDHVKVLLQTLYSVLVVMSGFFLLFAWQRLALHEEAAGFTVIGILTQFVILLLLLIFAYMLIRIWLENLPILHFYLISAFAFYTFLNVINVEKITVENNINRYEETGKIDLHYIERLGAEGVRGLIHLYEKYPDLPELKELLLAKKAELKQEDERFQSYNFARNEVKELLRELNLN